MLSNFIQGFSNFYQPLLQSSYFMLFVIITFGLLIGRIRLGSFSFDFSAVIFIALLFGHYGVKIDPVIQQIGILLFIFTIGIQAGPGFFRSFIKNGRSFILLAFIIVATGAIISAIAILAFGVDKNLVIGIFNGALTSTPGLAAAVEATNSPLSSIGYGIAYPFGVVGVVLFISLMPKIMKINLRKEEEKYQSTLLKEFPQIVTRDFIVSNSEVLGKPFSVLRSDVCTKQCITTKIFRENSVIIPHVDTHLLLGDIIRVVGPDPDMGHVSELVGAETNHAFPKTESSDAQWIFVTNKSIINKRIEDLNLFDNFNASIAVLKRSSIDISPDPTTHLRFGDRLFIAADRESFPAIISLFGNESKRLSETDFLPITLGIIIGIIIGSIPFNLGFFTLKLGLTGGVLAAALTLSSIGKTGPIIWSMSSNANLLIREFGLLLFLASVGCDAGAHLVETLVNNGMLLFGIGALISIIPMIIGWWLGSKLFKINLLSLFGLITGGMTSTPGLGAAAKHTDTNIPQIAYATVYPFALVLMIIFSKLLNLL